MGEKCILAPERDCLGLIRAAELEKDLLDLRTRNDVSHKEYFDRLAVLEAHNQVQDAHYEHIIEKLTDIVDKLAGLSERISVIESKPAKRWEGIVGQLIGIVVAAVAGFILARLGL